MARITRSYAGDVVSFIANYSKFVLLLGVPIGVYFYCHDFFFFNGEWLELLEATQVMWSHLLLITLSLSCFSAYQLGCIFTAMIFSFLTANGSNYSKLRR